MKVLEDGDLTGGIDDPALKEEMRNQEMENALRQVITRDAVSLALSVDANQITMWAQELLSYQTEEHDDEEEDKDTERILSGGTRAPQDSCVEKGVRYA